MNKIYNRQTGGYKIDIYIFGAYYSSTDWYTKCKDVKNRFLEINPNYDRQDVKCLFAKK